MPENPLEPHACVYCYEGLCNCGGVDREDCLGCAWCDDNHDCPMCDSSECDCGDISACRGCHRCRVERVEGGERLPISQDSSQESSQDSNKTWYIEDALDLIRALQPETRKFNYHLTLGGSVLNRGESEKDLDLVFLPLESGSEGTPDILLEYLKGLWGPGEILDKDYPEGAWEKKVSFTDRIEIIERFNNNSTVPAYDEYMSLPVTKRFSFAINDPCNFDLKQKWFKPSTPKLPSVMKWKMKFTRTDGKRIDVFIVGVKEKAGFLSPSFVDSISTDPISI